MGTGSLEAKLMLIGESPGKDEDREGIPFIGKAGKMLDSILTNIGLDRKEIFISNVLKCHPAYNHKPGASTIDICISNYLRKEIKLVKPELIVALGGMAAMTLLRISTTIILQQYRGTIYYTSGPLPSGIPFIVTYHPAAVLYQDYLLEFIVEDLEKAKRILAGEVSTRKKKVTNYQKLDSLYDIVGLEEAKWLDLDLETDGLDPFLPNKEILSLQLSIKEGEGYYFDWNEEISKSLRDFLRNFPAIGINGHNIKFDLKWLRVKAGIHVS